MSEAVQHVLAFAVGFVVTMALLVLAEAWSWRRK